MQIKLFLLIFAIATFGTISDSLAQTYAYLDEDGIRVFTNIAPAGPVQDLKISGEMPPANLPQSPDPKSRSLYNSIIEKYAHIYQLDPSLIQSIISVESGFNSGAVSKKGACGLMQLMPATAARLGVNNIFDPEQNIRGGIEHFRYLLDTFDHNLTLSLAAYNAGENLVRRLGRVPEIKETRNYIQSVLKHYDNKEIQVKTPGNIGIPAMFRYVDEAGVLQLTNIPPERRTNF